MKRKYPLGEGCWFCGDKGDEPLVFDMEFDTPVHLSCIRKALEEDPNHGEAGPMDYLLE
jgi:hypothetical protein